MDPQRCTCVKHNTLAHTPHLYGTCEYIEEEVPISDISEDIITSIIETKDCRFKTVKKIDAEESRLALVSMCSEESQNALVSTCSAVQAQKGKINNMDNITHTDSNFNLYAINNIVALVRIPKNLKDMYMKNIVELLFYKDNKFVTFSECQDEISIILDQSLITPFENNYDVQIMKDFKVMQIYEDQHGINHIGIVNKISGIFTQNNIPILYINTFNNNFILTSSNDYDKAIKILGTHGFTVFNDDS